MNPTKKWGELKGFGRVNSSCYARVICSVYIFRYALLVVSGIRDNVYT
jgi:hypothetical protein